MTTSRRIARSRLTPELMDIVIHFKCRHVVLDAGDAIGDHAHVELIERATFGHADQSLLARRFDYLLPLLLRG